MLIKYTKRAQKNIEKLTSREKRLIRDAIEGLLQTPPKGDIKPLRGYTDERYRLRVGRYRIIYRYANTGEIYILVLNVGSRGDIYKG